MFAWMSDFFRMDGKVSRIFAAVLFIGSLFYYGLYIQGIPYEQEEGVTRGWYEASKTPWADLFQDLLSLKSNELEADGANLIKIRVTESIAQKAITVLFGESMNAMALFYVLVTALFAIVVYVLAGRIIENAFIAFITTAYLLLMPAYGWNSMEFGSYSPLDQLLLAIFLLRFSSSFSKILNPDYEYRLVREAGNGVLLWFLGMIAVRAKEPNIFLVPVLAWTILLINPAANLFKCRPEFRKRLAGLILVAALLSIPILWTDKHPSNINPEWMCPLFVFVWNQSGWEPEVLPCLVTLKRAIPVSVMANFGFFLSWLLILSVLTLGIHKLINRSASKSGSKIFWPLVLLVWFGLSGAFFIHYCSLQFIRHQVWMLLPFTILAAFIFKEVINLPKSKITAVITAVVILGFTVEKMIDNVGHSIYVRQHLERLWVTKWVFREEVYKDIHQADKVSLFDLYNYWELLPDQARKVEPFLESEEDKSEVLKSREFADYVNEFGAGYIVSPLPIESAEGWTLKLLRHIDMNKMSWLTSIKKRKRDPRPYYLYRVTR